MNKKQQQKCLSEDYSKTKMLLMFALSLVARKAMLFQKSYIFSKKLNFIERLCHQFNI